MSSTTRHKSCVRCIQTKRKCDRTLPRCQRCVARGSECHYLNRHRHRPQPSSNLAVDQSAPISEPWDGQPYSNWQLQQYHGEPTTLLASGLDNAVFEYPNHPFNLGSMPDDAFSFDGSQDNAAQPVPSSTDRNVIRSTTPDTALQARVEFVAKRLAAVPRTFAEQGQTMFIHRMQFQQTCPRALQDAMSLCALYCIKGVANQTLVFQNLEHKCQQLIESTNVLLASKIDLLAALQALLLYQILRIFDGDIRLRAHTEADEHIMIQWANQLKAYMSDEEKATSLAQHSTDTSLITIACKSDWQSWLVDESIRRTVITSFMLKGIYSFLKLGYDTPVDLRFHFTALAALWGAQSDIGWRRAQEERERLEINVTKWNEAMVKARPVDLEDLGILIMTMLWGPEATRLWLGQDLSLKYGLEMA